MMKQESPVVAAIAALTASTVVVAVAVVAVVAVKSDLLTRLYRGRGRIDGPIGSVYRGAMGYMFKWMCVRWR